MIDCGRDRRGLRGCGLVLAARSTGSKRRSRTMGSSSCLPRRARLVVRCAVSQRAGCRWLPRLGSMNADGRGTSSLDYAERDELCDTAGESGALDDLDDALDLLVGKRGLLGEALVRRGADDDSPRLQLAAEVGAVDLLAGAGTGEGAAGTVAGGTEGALERSRFAGEHEARGAHAAGNEDGLAELPVRLRDLLRAGGEGARRALAVDKQRAAGVALDLGDVVGDVVDLPRLLRSLASEQAGDRGAHLVRDRLSVRPGEVRRRGHRSQVGAALGRGGGCAGELAVGEFDPVAAHD